MAITTPVKISPTNKAHLLSLLAVTSRVEVIEAIGNETLSVKQISSKLGGEESGYSPSRTSSVLSTLRYAQIVQAEKVGKEKHYQLSRTGELLLKIIRLVDEN